MLISDLTKLDVDVFQVLAVVGIWREDRYGNLHQVHVRANWKLFIGGNQVAVQILDELSKLKLEAAHDNLHQFHHALDFWIFVVLQPPRPGEYELDIIPYTLSEILNDVQMQLNQGSLAQFL